MTTAPVRVAVVSLMLAACLAAQTAESRPRRIALLRPPGFPTADASAIDDATLQTALDGVDVDRITMPSDLALRLSVRTHDLLVLSHGSAFPIVAWPAIRTYLGSGGSLVVFGGAPFHVPVHGSGATAAEPYVAAPRTPAFARELLIGPSEEIDCTGLAIRPLADLAWVKSLPLPSRAWTLTLRLTTKRDFEREDGSSGPRDAVVRPFIHLVDPQGVPRAAPFVEVDRISGAEAGGRWMFVPCDAPLGADFIRYTILSARAGAIAVDARPLHASVDSGEPARIRVQVRAPHALAPLAPAEASARVFAAADPKQPIADAPRVALSGTNEFAAGEIVIPTVGLEPGLYAVEVTTRAAGTADARTCGFWIRDEKLLAAGPKLSVSADWIRANGKVLPVVGTTYMASDVHRKFLFEPDPWTWDRDFAEMQRHGVNLVRTGLWTGWTRAMLDVGAIDEGVLRALDAYVQTAARHGILVCFNCFAFQPPTFGGTNPFLDPRALEGQKAFLTLVARRYARCGWIHYDLINEPSYAPADKLWTNQPIGDEYERRRWEAWLGLRHGEPLELNARLDWDDASNDVLGLPKADELAYTPWREGKRPRKAADFVRFSNQVVADWAGQLRDTLKVAGGDVLVTLGQDEGGTTVRPTQQLYYPSVDYTSMHTWWNTDDLLWDGVVTKVPEKPSLIQETGMMRLESERGFPWRTPEAAARLLERKFAYAFMARGCGAVQWAWNINPYMPVENEAVIGIFRPDGTAKPELRVIDSFAAFFAQIQDRLDDFEPESVLVVIPHARHFAGRPRGMDAVKMCVRSLAEWFGVVPAAISSETFTAARARGAKLIMLPVPEVVDRRLLAELEAAVEGGARVLITGGIEIERSGIVRDADRQPSAMGDSLVFGGNRPIAAREPTTWVLSSSVNAVATFDERCAEWLTAGVGELRKLEGRVWHEPLPLELAREAAPVRALYAAALRAAGVAFSPSAEPVAARVLHLKTAALIVCCNEMPRDAVRRVVVGERFYDVPVPAGRARLVFVDGATGDVVAATPGDPVTRGS